MVKIFNYKYLILIVILGAVLRFSALNQFPPSLNWDEISHGYNAYSILKTGHDEWGQLYPVVNFRAYGDYPLPLNLYLTIPFEIVFGLNQTGIRLPHALLGTLTIIGVYFLVMGLMSQTPTKDRNFVALLAAFLAAIDPWLLFPSRAVFQSNLSVFFLISAVALFLNRDKNKWFLPLSFFTFLLTLFSYHSTRIFTPIFLLVLAVIYKKYKFIILSFLGVFLILLPNATARANVVFIVDQAGINKIENLRNSSTSPFKKLLYNKATYFGEVFVKNYVNYFSPQFLFLNGGTQYQFSVPNHGLLYLVTLPFFYLGVLFVLIKVLKRKDRNYITLLTWLILAPIPAALTVDTSAVIRATTMLPIPEILIAIGFYEVLKRLPKYEILLTSVFIFAMFLAVENYMNIYAKSYTKDYSWAWQYGYEQAIDYVEQNYNKYDQIITTKAYGEPHEYFLFFLKYDPEKYMNDPNLIRFTQSNWWWVDHFDKFWFVNDWQVTQLASKNEFITESKHTIDCSVQKCLLITTPNNHPASWQLVNTVKFLDGKVAFEMWKN